MAVPNSGEFWKACCAWEESQSGFPVENLGQNDGEMLDLPIKSSRLSTFSL